MERIEALAKEREEATAKRKEAEAVLKAAPFMKDLREKVSKAKAHSDSLLAAYREAKVSLALAKQAAGKADAKGDGPIALKLDAIKMQRQEADHTARNLAIEKGLFWGTSGLVAKAAEQARKDKKRKKDPEFRKWDGSGRIGVQMQNGIPAADIFTDRSRQLRIEPLPEVPDQLVRDDNGKIETYDTKDLFELRRGPRNRIMRQHFSTHKETKGLPAPSSSKKQSKGWAHHFYLRIGTENKLVPGYNDAIALHLIKPDPKVLHDSETLRSAEEKGQAHKLTKQEVKAVQQYEAALKLAEEKASVIREDKGLGPVWAKFQLIYNRPFPEDGIVKWAWVIRKKVGFRFEYQLQVTVESSTYSFKPANSDKAIAFDLGWRVKSKGSAERGAADTMRVWYWYDEDGKHGEFLLPDGSKNFLSHPDVLRGIRDDSFNIAKDLLVAFVAGKTSKLPRWLEEVVPHLHKWKSHRRLLDLVATWQTNRFSGDGSSNVEGAHRYWRDHHPKRQDDPNDNRNKNAADTFHAMMSEFGILPTLAAWRKQELHLYSWESNERESSILWRREELRKAADKFFKENKYGICIFEDFKLTEVVKKPEPEKEDHSPERARRHRHHTAPGQARVILQAAAYKYGASIVKEDPYMSTMECWFCGHSELWDPIPKINHKCAKCGRKWDQDKNAAHNLLTRALRKLRKQVA
jgi:hypothetical protein